MTIPRERKNAVLRTHEFLRSLCDPKQTPRVPGDVRREARSLLKHYPSEMYMDIAAEQAPEVFGDKLNS
jgi:HEPN domain-containing protein